MPCNTPVRRDAQVGFTRKVRLWGLPSARTRDPVRAFFLFFEDCQVNCLIFLLKIKTFDMIHLNFSGEENMTMIEKGSQWQRK
ncbi:MAG: hypothetical protein D6814_09740 [Calditrichaeota bacterium]|nr:MAG: hypothetical protein D6814_09740 [Calditrichota bacterium]